MSKSAERRDAASTAERNLRRRKRFAASEEYAERVRQGRRESDRKISREKREARVVTGVRPVKPVRSAVDQITGEAVPGYFYLVSQFAAALGVSAQTVRSWERSGKLEASRYRSRSGYRLYTLEYIEAAVMARKVVDN